MKIPKVTNCARCGKNHTDVTAHPFVRPPPRTTHWAPCPVTGDPILICVVKEFRQRDLAGKILKA